MTDSCLLLTAALLRLSDWLRDADFSNPAGVEPALEWLSLTYGVSFRFDGLTCVPTPEPETTAGVAPVKENPISNKPCGFPLPY